MDGISNLKAGALRSGANALRFKVWITHKTILRIQMPSQGDVLYNGADSLDNAANNLSPTPPPR